MKLTTNQKNFNVESNIKDIIREYKVISLNELNKKAELMTRKDSKYIVNETQLKQFLLDIKNYFDVLNINDLDVKRFGSQGQQRTAVLSLKLAELELMKAEVGEYPVLLLDDVMSELDLKRQNYLVNNLKGVQTFITTTMINQLALKNKEDHIKFIVSGGKVNTL